MDIKKNWYIPTLSIIASILLGFAIYIFVQQADQSQWISQTFRVEFDEESGLMDYGGCYDYIVVIESPRYCRKS